MTLKLSKTQILWISLIAVLLIIAIVLTACNKKSTNSITKPKLVTNSAQYITLIDKNIGYLKTSNNQLQTINITNKKTSTLFKTKLPTITNLIWSPDNNYALVNEILDEKISTSIVDIKTNKLTPPQGNNAYYSTWSPDSKRYAYLSPHDENFEIFDLYISDLSNTNGNLIASVGVFGSIPVVQWKNENEILILKPFYKPPENPDFNESDIPAIVYNINPNTNQISKSTINPGTTDMKTSPDGKYFIFTDQDVDNSFYLSDSNGLHKIDIPIQSMTATTWSTDNKSLYIVNNDITSSDNNLIIYKIDLSNYQATPIKQFNLQNTAIIIDSLLVSPENKAIIEIDNNIYVFDI